MITIPVIDISPFTESGPGTQAVVDAVRTACEEHGFFVAAGHGIAPDVHEDLDRACRAFFSRPLQEKSAVVCPADTSIDRLSVPLFFNPSLDVRVQTVPTCLAPGEPPADPVTAGEWIARKTYATT